MTEYKEIHQSYSKSMSLRNPPNDIFAFLKVKLLAFVLGPGDETFRQGCAWSLFELEGNETYLEVARALI
jgi:hypothetical protein